MKRLSFIAIFFVLAAFLYSQDNGPRVLKALGNGQGFELVEENADTTTAKAEVPSRVRKAAIKQLSIDPKKGGEIIDIQAWLEEHHGNNELWNVEVSFRLYPDGNIMEVITKVQTKDWEK
jgi:hypothetical protein